MTIGPSKNVRQPPAAAHGVHLGDARALTTWFADTAPTDEIMATITSPPYGDLKDYGQQDQIGWAQPYEQYLADCRDIWASLYQQTSQRGSLWIVADTLRLPNASQGPWRLEPLPFHLADEASKAGWVLRDVVIWRKDRSVPWSGRGRLRNEFEYLLQFVKSDGFKYNVDRIRNPARLEEWWVRFPERYHPFGKVPSNVWDIPIPRQGAWHPTTAAPHSCPLPGELIERIVLLSTDPGDLVFDPFAGVGSVIAHAERLGRRGLGLESHTKFVDAYWSQVRPDVLAKHPTLSDSERVSMASDLSKKLITLRILKYPRVLYEAVRDLITEGVFPPPIAISVIARRRARTQPSNGVWAEVDMVVAAEGSRSDRHRLQAAFASAALRRPASKFGISSTIRVVAPSAFADTVGRQKLHYYPAGRTWRCERPMTLEDVVNEGRNLVDTGRRVIPPIVSNLHVSESPRPIG